MITGRKLNTLHRMTGLGILGVSCIGVLNVNHRGRCPHFCLCNVLQSI